MLSRDLIQRALKLPDNGLLKIDIPGGESKIKSLRVSLYKAKKELDLEDEITISFKNSVLTLTKCVMPEIRIVETTVEELEKLPKDSSGVTQTNIDNKRIQTIREKLSIFDKEKEVLIEQFRTCKLEIESQDDISEEDKQFLIGRSLEIVNNEIEKLNAMARTIAEESRKVKD